MAHKVRDRELGTATATSADLFARDVFSFWAPLDERFVEAIVKLSHLLKIDFCSFFWMQYFYSYLEYDEQRSAMKPAQLFALLNAEAARNILSDKLSTTGVKYGSLIFLPLPHPVLRRPRALSKRRRFLQGQASHDWQ